MAQVSTRWRFILPGVLAAQLASLPASAGAMRLPLFDEAGRTAVFVADDETVRYEAPLVGTIEVTTPANVEARLPELRPHLRGFSIVEAFEAGRTEAGSKARARWRLRLTPGGEGPWRLMPFVLTFRDVRTGAQQTVLTRAVDFPAPPALPAASGAPECDLEPEWVAPGWRTIGLWAGCAAALAALLAAAIPLARRARRALHERTLSPEVRARLELDRLLAEGLLARRLFKPFYFGLTGVIRRYFERGYALRATRQTTEEFLASLSGEARIGQAAREALAAFLNAADRVKFAGVEASKAEAEAAVRRAREFIDAADAQQKGETHA